MDRLKIKEKKMGNSNFFNMNFLTPNARKVLLIAQKEAKRLNHDCIGTEHILLGILFLNDGVAVAALEKM